jgi:hypothetical protein
MGWGTGGKMKYYEVIIEKADIDEKEIHWDGKMDINWESEKDLLHRWPWLEDVVSHDHFWQISWCIGLTKIWVKSERV